ncbi:glycogen/starch synthase [Micromonospora schwarzwaldensis]|uniref:glycogen/starch synthase n=1 Tax=Micromonospora sp. DSM 45708 TaxID=3111767 RepID=UPI0031E14589
MHIVECSFECGGFDVALMRGGMSLQSWHMAREFVREGHQVSVITPAHGAADYLVEKYGARPLDYRHRYDLPLVLDPDIWRGFPAEQHAALTTTVYHTRIDGVDLYYLSNEYLDLLPDTLYPAAASEGRDLSFFKPLAFQMDAVHLLRTLWPDEHLVVHAHEPYYHFLVSAAFRDDPRRLVVSTINSNMPVNRKVYRPQVERLLDQIGVRVDLTALADPEPAGDLDVVMREHLPTTRLYQPQRLDDVCVISLVTICGDALEFLSEGQRDYFFTFHDTPFEKVFPQLTVARAIRENAGKFFVGGSGVSAEWLARDPDETDRRGVLADLGLDPDRPTFYHAARYSLHHKGQLELMRAIDEVLHDEKEVNFVLRCVTASGRDARARAGNDYFQEVAERYPDNVRLDWSMTDPDTLFAHASAADFCIYPSKFELESFLIAQAEAMVCGAVPIGTDQQGTNHLGHAWGTLTGTGLAVRRSFRDDDPRLVEDLVATIRRALEMICSRPDEYRRLSRRARAVGRTFIWSRLAQQHLAVYRSLLDGRADTGPTATDAIRYGWFDLLPARAWRERRDDIARQALALGDADAYGRCAVLDEPAYRELFEAAYRRADFVRCTSLAARSGLADLVHRLRSRCRLTQADGRWQLRYTFAEAERVDLFVPSTGPGTNTGPSRRPEPMRQDGHGFVIALDAPPPHPTLHFLLTLRSGRTGWDEVTVAGGADPDPGTP